MKFCLGSAWNAVIKGSKKWILFPPRVPPPGVHPTTDGSTVATSVSLIECDCTQAALVLLLFEKVRSSAHRWFINFYPEAQKLAKAVGGMEGVCREGELIFVPRGWWHCVVNLEESIAVRAIVCPLRWTVAYPNPCLQITQNYVSSTNLPEVCRFLRTKREQVSGLEQQQDALSETACEAEAKQSLYDRFIGALRDDRPELLEPALDEAQTMERELQRRRRQGGSWATIVPNAEGGSREAGASAGEPAGFRFSFGTAQ